MNLRIRMIQGQHTHTQKYSHRGTFSSRFSLASDPIEWMAAIHSFNLLQINTKIDYIYHFFYLLLLLRLLRRRRLTLLPPHTTRKMLKGTQMNIFDGDGEEKKKWNSQFSFLVMATAHDGYNSMESHLALKRTNVWKYVLIRSNDDTIQFDHCNYISVCCVGTHSHAICHWIGLEMIMFCVQRLAESQSWPMYDNIVENWSQFHGPCDGLWSNNN